MFGKYHYLSQEHKKNAVVYVCFINDCLGGFLSVIHFPNSHIKNFKRVHRLVILPEYQGLGIGKLLLNTIAKIYTDMNFVFTIITSHPKLIKSLNIDQKWVTKRLGRAVFHNSQSKLNKDFKKTNSSGRFTGTFEYRGGS